MNAGAMADDWPDEPVPTILAAMFDGATLTLHTDYNRGAVLVTIEGQTFELSPEEARTLATGYEDSLDDEQLQLMEARKGIDRLRQYADRVEPYRPATEE